MEGLGRGCLCVWEQQGYSKQGYNDIGCSFKLSMLSEIQVRDFISQKGWAIPFTEVSNGLASEVPVICGEPVEASNIEYLCVNCFG